MEILAAIDPVTRVEGHLKVEIKVDTVSGVQQVVDAWSVGTLFRGFEKILVNRDPRDAQYITERICGVCPVAHGQTAVLALDRAFGVTPPENARILRNLVNGANFVDSHILHFYHLTLLDFVDGPDQMPWQPAWKLDRRFDAPTRKALLDNYVRALDMRRKAHELGAIFGGRLPHPPAYVPGGFTAIPKASDLTTFKACLGELIPFIRNVYIPDVERVAATYSDYASIGRGPGNLLAFGAFELNAAGSSRFFPSGRVLDGSTSVETLDVGAIAEEVTRSWYSDSTNRLDPAHGVTDPAYPKTDAYSWLKAPRYAGLPYEVGPLARLWIRGDYQKGISVVDRHRARAMEALLVAEAMDAWIDQLRPSEAVYVPCSVPAAATASGLSEAPRGALGHWLEVTASKISRYQIVTPTCWNCSPRDGQSRKGPLEQALVGTPIADATRPIEALRVVHSFDPCLDCAVH